MPAFETIIKKSSVHFAENAEEAQQAAIEELIDAWEAGYDIHEIFEIEVIECEDEPK